MEHSESISELTKALIQCQLEFEAIGFDATNPFFRSKYATLAEVIESTRPVLNKNGLAICQLISGRDGMAGVETVLIHKDGEFISGYAENPIPPQTYTDGNKVKERNQAQAAGIIYSYLKRYGWMSILGVYASDEDTDGSGLGGGEKQALAESVVALIKQKASAHTEEIKSALNESGSKGSSEKDIYALSIAKLGVLKAALERIK